MDFIIDEWNGIFKVLLNLFVNALLPHRNIPVPVDFDPKRNVLSLESDPNLKLFDNLGMQDPNV